MQSRRRESNQLAPAEQRRSAYAVSYACMSSDLTELSVGTAFVITDDQESAETFAWEVAFGAYPEEEGFNSHLIAVQLVRDQVLRDLVESWESPVPVPAPALPVSHPRNSRNLESRTHADDGRPTCSVFGCFRQAVEFDKRKCKWRCAQHLEAK